MISFSNKLRNNIRTGFELHSFIFVDLSVIFVLLSVGLLQMAYGKGNTFYETF